MASPSEKEIQATTHWRDNMSSSSNEANKAAAAVNEKEVGADDESGSVHWVTGWRNRFPWVGFGCLAAVLFCIAFCIVVVVTSNLQSQEDWPVHITWERVSVIISHIRPDHTS